MTSRDVEKAYSPPTRGSVFKHAHIGPSYALLGTMPPPANWPGALPFRGPPGTSKSGFEFSTSARGGGPRRFGIGCPYPGWPEFQFGLTPRWDTDVNSDRSDGLRDPGWLWVSSSRPPGLRCWGLPLGPSWDEAAGPSAKRGSTSS